MVNTGWTLRYELTVYHLILDNQVLNTKVLVANRIISYNSKRPKVRPPSSLIYLSLVMVACGALHFCLIFIMPLVTKQEFLNHLHIPCFYHLTFISEVLGFDDRRTIVQIGKHII